MNVSLVNVSLKIYGKIYGASLCLLAVLLTVACHSKSAGETPDIPVTAFLQDQMGQLNAAASLTLYKTHNGKRDSGSISSSDVKTMTAPFLSSGLGKPGWTAAYRESTFPDSSNHRTVISYQALSDSTPLNMVDIYIDPDTKSVRKMYLQYVVQGTDSSIRKQLIWETDKSFTLITTVDKNEYTSDLLQQKVIWNKP
jgi:hypothetical protein